MRMWHRVALIPSMVAINHSAQQDFTPESSDLRGQRVVQQIENLLVTLTRALCISSGRTCSD
jgi:hypothetical protein